MNIFRISVLAVFVVALVFGVLSFSGIISIGGGDDPQVRGTVTLWGTTPEKDLAPLLEEIRLTNNKKFTLIYVEKHKASFDQDLVEALASGTGPDMILLPHDLILRHRDKVYPIPYETFSIRNFRDAFIEEGELYLHSLGTLALPFSIDPLVMYWNRDLFSSAGVAEPPRYWDEFFTLSQEITQTDTALNVIVATIALGEYQNIENAKDILSLLMLQSGESITEDRGGRIITLLGDRYGLVVPPAESALRFYTEFSNSAKPFYSWNRSLRQDKDLFVAGDLAVYLGYASERSEIEAKSPNLNFDIAPIPQARDGGKNLTFGRMSGVAILKSTQNFQTAFFATFLLTNKESIQLFMDASGLPSVRRDLSGIRAGGAYGEVLRSGALISRGWLDPEPKATDAIFKTMIEDVVSGRQRISSAVLRAQKSLSALLK